MWIKEFCFRNLLSISVNSLITRIKLFFGEGLLQLAFRKRRTKYKRNMQEFTSKKEILKKKVLKQNKN